MKTKLETFETPILNVYQVLHDHFATDHYELGITLVRAENPQEAMDILNDWIDTKPHGVYTPLPCKSIDHVHEAKHLVRVEKVVSVEPFFEDQQVLCTTDKWQGNGFPCPKKHERLTIKSINQEGYLEFKEYPPFKGKVLRFNPIYFDSI